MTESSHDWEVFERIATVGGWGRGSNESLSGSGSSLAVTETLRRRLVKVLSRLGVRSLVDAPCGDMNWMRHLDYQFDKYIGVDIAPTIIAKLRAAAFPPQYHFQIGNLATDVLPAADALFCRDCLVHLPNEAILSALRLWKMAGFKFVLTTTFVGRTDNIDCPLGSWRPLNLQIEPFNWSNPIMMVLEDLADPTVSDKAVGVWAL